MPDAKELIRKIEQIAADPDAKSSAMDAALNEMVTLLTKDPQAWDLCTDTVRFQLNERFCYTGPLTSGGYR